MVDINQLRREQIEEYARQRTAALKKTRPLIQIVDLHKSFNGHEVLRGVNLTIEEGKNTVIIGPSGTGKSVLLKHIIGLIKPDKGEIWVDGVDITKLTGEELNEIRKKFGMCFQMAALFDSMTVGENVAFPLYEHTKLPPEEIERRVKDTLLKVGLKGIENRHSAELSGGMQKRVGLARAVIMNPAIVLYDEPTTGLDPLLTQEIDNLILDAQRQFHVTSVIISHDVGSIFRIADHIAMLDQGKIVFEGNPEETLRSTHPKVQTFITTFG